MADTNAEFPTTIGADAVFKGELTFEKGVRLLGTFEGEIESKGQLVIAEGAKLNGNVKASNVQIEGHVKGNLTTNGKVQLASSARLEGDLQTARLEVAEGAVLIGRCMVGVNGKADGLTPRGTKTSATTATPIHTGKPKPVGVGAK
ncbi:MAG: polymer-forming cytoskeletal protein [Phycisphaerae bacterium]